MKIGSQNPGGWQHAPIRSLAAGGEVPAGSLIVSDDFLASDPADERTHGGSVVAAARSLGFQGPVYYQQSATEQVPEFELAQRALQLIGTPGMSPDVVAKALETWAVGPPLHILQTAADEVRQATRSGAANSVLNLSSGTSKSQVSNILYCMASPAWSSADAQAQQNGLVALENYAQLFGLDKEKLLSPLPEVSQPERRALQNRLIGTVDQAWSADPRIAAAQHGFSQAVVDFEAGRNSVVLAAGNEGFIKLLLEADGLGELALPADFERNVLDSPEVTLVGASIVLDGAEVPARYTSGDQEIDVYASGDKVLGREFDDSAGLNGAGTSTAAPRVGAVMAALHRAHPTLGSRQIEALLSAQLTISPLALLDYGKAQVLFSPT